MASIVIEEGDSSLGIAYTRSAAEFGAFLDSKRDGQPIEAISNLNTEPEHFDFIQEQFMMNPADKQQHLYELWSRLSEDAKQYYNNDYAGPRTQTGGKKRRVRKTRRVRRHKRRQIRK